MEEGNDKISFSFLRGDFDDCVEEVDWRNSVDERAVLLQPAAASCRNFLEIQILVPYPRTLGVGAAICFVLMHAKALD